MHGLFVRHHVTPGAYYKMPRGERLFLTASLDLELEDESKALEEVKRRGSK